MKMKIRIVLAALLAVVAVGCKKDARTEEIVVASMKPVPAEETVVTEVFPNYIIKKGGDDKWGWYYGGIQGFEFEEGYECRLLVEPSRYPEGYQDAGSLYILKKVLSKEKKDSDVSESLCIVNK